MQDGLQPLALLIPIDEVPLLSMACVEERNDAPENQLIITFVHSPVFQFLTFFSIEGSRINE